MAETPYQRVGRQQREREAARELQAKQLLRRTRGKARKIAGSTLTGSTLTLDRQREADRIDGYDRDDLGESPDF